MFYNIYQKKSMEGLNEVYQNFIKNKLYTNELTAEDISILFNLHNNHVDILAPQYNKSCSSCIRRVLNKVRKVYEGIKDEI